MAKSIKSIFVKRGKLTAAGIILAVIAAAVLLLNQLGIIDFPFREEPSYSVGDFSYEDVPEFSGKAYVKLNGNVPYFDPSEYTAESFEHYEPLDKYGRCVYAFACVGKDLMPTEDRGEIGSVTPSGWNQRKYDTKLVEGGYLYNRCHLIGFQLTGENATKENLITGTRYFNIEGMLIFENEIADYIKETGNHVLYRVTPIYVEDELVARGAILEAYSVEDNGEGVCFCVFSYNVQPGIEINYSDGSSNKK